MLQSIKYSHLGNRRRVDSLSGSCPERIRLPAAAAVRELVVSNGPARSYMLWIDGVGAWQLYAGNAFSFGAPTFESVSADVTLQANISRRHATLHYESDHWRVSSDHLTTVSGRTVNSAAELRSGDQLCLADRVKLGFRIPSILSSSAVIDFESNHRPPQTVDGIILMVDHCLLGPTPDQHICCPDLSDVVVLYVQNGFLHCRSSLPLNINEKSAPATFPLKHGSVVDGEALRFRIEEIR